jgi:hypothetical protein
LLETFESVLVEYRSSFVQERVFERARALTIASSVTFARKTMTQLLVTLDERDRDWGPSYRLLSRGRFDGKAVAASTLGLTLRHVPPSDPYTVVIDATHVGRSSLKMPGTFWTRAPGTARWAPGFSRQQRFENVCWLTPVEDGFRRAVPLRWIHAPSPKAVPSRDGAIKEWEAGLEGVRWARERLDAEGRADQRLLVFADGSYDAHGLWSALPSNTVLVARCAKNRKLFSLAIPDPAAKRGARRKFGPRVPPPSEMRRERTSWSKIEIPVRGRPVYVKCRVAGPYLVEGASGKPLMLVLVKGYNRRGAKRRARKPPCQYLVNAVQADGKWGLPLPLKDVVEGTWHRWEIEVCHREIKTGFGLGQMQCWSQRASTASVEFVAWHYSVALLAGYRAWNGLTGGPRPVAAKWWPGSRRWSIGALLQSLRAELWSKSHPPGIAGIPAKRQLIPTGANTLQQAVIGSMRG